jgi:hypothetical protein
MLLYVAAALIFLVGLAHSFLGERYILVRLLRKSDLPKLFGDDTFTRQTLRFAWHVTTVTWWGIAVLLIVLAKDRATLNDVANVIGVTLLICGLLPLIMTKGKHLSWVAFFLIGAFVLYWSKA